MSEKATIDKSKLCGSYMYNDINQKQLVDPSTNELLFCTDDMFTHLEQTDFLTRYKKSGAANKCVLGKGNKMRLVLVLFILYRLQLTDFFYTNSSLHIKR